MGSSDQKGMSKCYTYYFHVLNYQRPTQALHLHSLSNSKTYSIWALVAHTCNPNYSERQRSGGLWFKACPCK
jgi:hypothetical protein